MSEQPEPEVLNGQLALSRGTPAFEELKRKHFTPEGKAQRVARALAALRAAIVPTTLPLDAVRKIAEDPNLEGN